MDTKLTLAVASATMLTALAIGSPASADASVRPVGDRSSVLANVPCDWPWGQPPNPIQPGRH